MTNALGVCHQSPVSLPAHHHSGFFVIRHSGTLSLVPLRFRAAMFAPRPCDATEAQLPPSVKISADEYTANCKLLRVRLFLLTCRPLLPTMR